MLCVFNEQLAKDGAVIMEFRKSFLEKINSFANKIHKEICGENLKLVYTPSIECDIINEEVFYKKLEQSATREIENGTSLYGIQRDDIRFMIDEKDAKIYASQGQQRTVVLSSKMAQMEIIKAAKGEEPILLLDDIMSELDISRRSYLAGKIKDKQVLITCTDIDTLGGSTPDKTFRVENGKIVN